MSEYSIRKIDSSAGITDVRFVEYSTILVPKSGGTFTGNVMSPAFSATTISGGTFYGDGTNLINVTDTYITGQTFSTGDYKLTSVLNDNTTLVSDLSILATDMVVTGGTYDIVTGVVTFTNNSGATFDVSGFTSGMTDSFTTSATLSGNEIQFANNIYGANYYRVDLEPLLSTKTDVSLFDTYTGDTATELASKALQTDFVTHSGDTSIHFTKESLNSIFVNKSGDTMDGGLVTPSVSATTISGDTLYGDGSNLTGIGAGASVNLTWKFSTTTTESSPASKRFRLNNAEFSATTKIFVNDESNNGIDASTLLSVFDTGDRVYLQQNDDGTKAAAFTISAATIDNTGWWTIPVSYDADAGGGIPTSNKECGFIFFNVASGGSGGSGTGLTDTIIVGENVVSGNIVYLNTDGKYWKADSSAEATSSTELRLVNETILADASGEAIIRGQWEGLLLSTGSTYWLSTGGNFLTTQPSGNGDIVRYIGTALNNNILEFNPDELFVEITNVNVNVQIEPSIRAITGSTTLLATDFTANVTATGNTTTTLPTAVGIAGRIYNIKNTGGGIVTIDTTSSQTIDGGLTAVLSTQYQSITVQSDGTNWIII